MMLVEMEEEMKGMGGNAPSWKANSIILRSLPSRRVVSKVLRHPVINSLQGYGFLSSPNFWCEMLQACRFGPVLKWLRELFWTLR
jgi:hypothetical protein